MTSSSSVPAFSAAAFSAAAFSASSLASFCAALSPNPAIAPALSSIKSISVPPNAEPGEEVRPDELIPRFVVNSGLYEKGSGAVPEPEADGLVGSKVLAGPVGTIP